LIFQLAGRASRDTAEAGQLGIPLPSASFGQVRWDRYCGTPNLGSESFR
jgi:hypothetical protein